MNYFEKHWINKNPQLYNYSYLINDILKTKNNYIKNNIISFQKNLLYQI